MDFDTGKETSFGEYKLGDETYSKLLAQLAQHNFDQVTPELQGNILHYYATAKPPAASDKAQKDWPETEKQLEQLKSHTAQPVIEQVPVPVKN